MPETGADTRDLAPSLRKRARVHRYSRVILYCCLIGALFARVIVQDAAIILLDEPFAAVDAQSLTVLLDQVTRWHEEGRTVIVVLHDLNLVRAHFPSTLVLARRCLAWGTTEVALPAMAA